MAPQWSHCLSYEYELRREVYKKCREQNIIGFSAAWWETYGDSEHRMLHWLQLVSLANSAPSTSDQSIASMVQKEVAAQLQSSGVDRSWTPRGRQIPRVREQRRKREQTFAAHSTSTTCSSLSRCARTAHAKSEPNSKAKATSRGRRPCQRAPAGSVWLLRDLLRGGTDVANMLHQNQANGICYAFQEGSCQLLVHTPTRMHRMWRTTWVQPVRSATVY